MNVLKTVVICCATLCTSTTLAQDFVAIQVEAENYFSKDGRWHLTSASVNPGISPDPDGSHHSSASGQAYLEILSDTRVTHGDPLINGQNFWSTGGSGPAIDYIVNIPETGRYTVWVKAYSTGTEDNGVHVGLNSSNPASGERIQWCNGKNQWTWSSAQRTSSNHCGTPRTIYLDIGNAGANTIRFTAREDGFEIDQFMLIKENAPGLSCQPNNNDGVSCNQPATPAQPVSQPVTPTQPTPTPTPAPAPETPFETETSDTQPAVSNGSLPNCTSSDSDPDGDGFGWENNQSCVVVNSASSPGSSSASTESSAGGLAICASAASDPDGDGFGWENEQSCLVAADEVANSDVTGGDAGVIFCTSADSDSDGDGWGWENDRSCVVQ